MFDLNSLNFFAIVVAGFSGFVLGGLWYSPRMFGPMWKMEKGIRDELWVSPVWPMTSSIVGSLITAFAIAVLVQAMQLSGIASGLKLGLLLGFGVVAAGVMTDALFLGDSIRAIAIQAGYRVLNIVFISLIITLWP